MHRLHVARVFSSPISGVYSTHIDSDHHFGRHWHDDYGFGFLEHGAQVWWSGRGNVRGYAGDVITTNPGEVHDGRPLGDPTRRWRILYIDVDAMASVTAHHGQHAEIARPVIRDRALLHALGRLFSRLERWNACRGTSGNPVEALAFEESLVESCVQLMARHGSAPVKTDVPPENLGRVRERLADNVSEAPSLADLAAMTGLSRYQVLRRFEKAFGLPPHAWLLRRRAERARLLIRDGSTLATAAADCGFVDQSHMTRVFVRQFGFTPGAWRKASILQ
jgi:AraC-like DNA-binding protein